MKKVHVPLLAADQMNITFDGRGQILEKRHRKALVVLTLYSKLNADDTGVFEVSDNDIMGNSRQNTWEVQREMKDVITLLLELEAMGKLEIVEHMGKEYNKPSKYRLLHNAPIKRKVRELHLCSVGGVSLSRLVGVIKANLSGGSAYSRRMCNC